MIRLKKLIKSYQKNYGKRIKEENISETNIWIYQALEEAKKKKKHEEIEKNKVLYYLIGLNWFNFKDCIHLYRLLAIKHRIRFPLKGKELKIEKNIVDILDDKICSTFLK